MVVSSQNNRVALVRLHAARETSNLVEGIPVSQEARPRKPFGKQPEAPTHQPAWQAGRAGKNQRRRIPVPGACVAELASCRLRSSARLFGDNLKRGPARTGGCEPIRRQSGRKGVVQRTGEREHLLHESPWALGVVAVPSSAWYAALLL
jgi:hypothetical protein